MNNLINSISHSVCHASWRLSFYHQVVFNVLTGKDRLSETSVYTESVQSVPQRRGTNIYITLVFPSLNLNTTVSASVGSWQKQVAGFGLCGYVI